MSTQEIDKNIGVLLVSHGSPETIDDLPAFLTNIFAGRQPSSQEIEEAKQRYIAIGGRSPLNEITRKQALALEIELNNVRPSTYFSVYAGMRYWHPFVRQAIEEMLKAHVQQAVVLILNPFYSPWSQSVKEVFEEIAPHLPITFIQSWYNDRNYINLVASRVTEALNKIREHSAKPVLVIFTAHSLPLDSLSQDNMYLSQLEYTCQSLSQITGIKDYLIAYHARRSSSKKWLRPALFDVVEDLCKRRQEPILMCPIGFVSDNLEILYDIDIECRRIASSSGIYLARTRSLNDDPEFIRALADIVLRHVL